MDRSNLTPKDIRRLKKESRIYRFRDYTWEGVEVTGYKNEGGDWARITRQVLVGDLEDTAFQYRYFEIAPGGHSSLEKHKHTHTVTVIRGTGQVVLGKEAHVLGFLDTVYVAPGQPHQFICTGKEPFGFLCTVNAKRDKPEALSAEELADLAAAPAGRIMRTAQAPSCSLDWNREK